MRKIQTACRSIAKSRDPPLPATAVLSWLHIGGLHITDGNEQNHRDLQRIVALANGLPPGSVDFALLPGDQAEDGAATQFRLVRDATAPLWLPLHTLTGDHDFKPRRLDAFYGTLGARRLPYAASVKNTRCLSLDVVSSGTGGPDFRLGADQVAWARRELEMAAAAGENAALFMHTYPADLREGADELGALLAVPHVLWVDMGHTHYNELANDGGTIFMATRSTGQIEEGPPGFSVAALDGRCVSWRFKALDHAWPFVLITSPVDRHLLVDMNQAVQGPFVTRVKVLGDAPIDAVEIQVADGAWTPMTQVPGAAALWQASCDLPASGRAGIIRARARDTEGRHDEDRIESAHPGWTAPERTADGSDRDRVGAWPEKGIFDTQLGPNRNGRKW